MKCVAFSFPPQGERKGESGQVCWECEIGTEVGFSSRSVLTLEVSNLPEMMSNLHSLTVTYRFFVTEEPQNFRSESGLTHDLICWIFTGKGSEVSVVQTRGWSAVYWHRPELRTLSWSIKLRLGDLPGPKRFREIWCFGLKLWIISWTYNVGRDRRREESL